MNPVAAPDKPGSDEREVQPPASQATAGTAGAPGVGQSRAVAGGGAPKPSGVTVRTVVRTGLLVLAVSVAAFVLWLVTLSGLSYQRSQDALRSQFDAELVDAVAPVNAPVAIGDPLAVLEIPAMGTNEVVVEGTSSTQTAAAPGHLRTSALPGQPGVSVIMGRRAGFGGVFGRLGSLGEGDDIRVTTGQGTFTYRVSSVAGYDPDDASAFVADGNALVLVTSSPPLLASERLAVKAQAVGDLAERGTRVPQAPPEVSELGLGGDAGAAVGLLVWLELLVVAAIAAVVLARRWLFWPAWIIAAPVVAATAWMVFEYLALLLPATL
jgi:sortase A